jgi:hypothetical protein
MRFNPNLGKMLGIGICGNMRKLSHNKGYEPSTNWLGYVYKFIMSL